MAILLFSGCIENIPFFEDKGIEGLTEEGFMPSMTGFYGSEEMISIAENDIFMPTTQYSIKFYNDGQDQKYVARTLPEPTAWKAWSIKIYIDQNPNPTAQEQQFVDVKIAREEGNQISDVYFDYAVSSATASNFIADAYGDLDGDGVEAHYTIGPNTSIEQPTGKDAY